jgi:hypothetical protein
MTKLPVKPVSMPSSLKGVQNGRLPETSLESCGVASYKMHPTAARAMRALVAAAKAAGFDVRATGTYRSLESQERLFRQRYVAAEIKGRPTKKWNGVTYWQRPNTAMAATPGTSNHGLGLAIDFAEERDGKPGVESVSAAFVAWLIKHADAYGYSAEAQSEPWHWRYVAGDAVPAKVLEHEGAAPAPKPEQLEQPARPTLRRGDKGPQVEQLQRILTAKGFSTRGIDGVFGKFTAGAVRRFQAAHPATGRPDGIVGPRTWKALVG